MKQQIYSFPMGRIAHFFLLLSLLLISVLIKAQEASVDSVSNVAILVFDHEDYDFGDVYEGEKVEHIFSFKNTGSGTLVIQNVISTCGCTAPEWPKEPMVAGTEGKIRIVFNSKGKIGRQNKVITVRSNTRDGDVRLFITAMVLPKKKG
jgi:hypothetical protein